MKFELKNQKDFRKMNMKNFTKCIFLALFLLMHNVPFVFANVPDMEFFLPTEYQHLTELHEKDAQKFIKKNADFLQKCDFLNSKILDGREYPEQKVLYDDARVFSEGVNGEKYIWVLLSVGAEEASEIQLAECVRSESRDQLRGEHGRRFGVCRV